MRSTALNKYCVLCSLDYLKSQLKSSSSFLFHSYLGPTKSDILLFICIIYQRLVVHNKDESPEGDEETVHHQHVPHASHHHTLRLEVQQN